MIKRKIRKGRKKDEGRVRKRPDEEDEEDEREMLRGGSGT